MIVTAILTRATKNAMSATASNLRALLSFFDRMAKKEKIQLTTSRIAARPVVSSMMVACVKLDILMDVNTTGKSRAGWRNC